LSKRVVELCQKADIPELFPLFAQWYKFNPRMQEREFFDWQFRDGPVRLSEGEYDFLVLRGDDGRIAGCLGFVGFEFVLDGAVRTGGWTHNWYAEDQQDGGLALLGRFMELVDNRFLLRLNDKSGTLTRLLRIPFLPAMPRWWAAIDAAQAAAVLGFDETSDRAILARSAAMIQRIEAAPRIARVARFAPEDEFGFAHLGGIAGHARRTGRYLNWRYVDIPKHDYRIIRSDEAFAVYRVETVMGSEASVIRLVEWTFGPKEAAAALSTIRADAQERNPVLFDFHCTHRPLGQALGPLGFMPQNATTKPMPDLFRPAFSSGGYAVAIDLPPHRTVREIDFDRWYITIGDSDIDRVKL
jgi:hypothetical protein